MIIAGASSKDLGSRKLQGYKCTNCEMSDVYVHAVVLYGTFFFIPLFPANKKYTSVCGNCNQVLTKEQMPQRMLDKLKLEKQHFKSPFYLYSGLMIIAVLFGLFIYYYIKDQKEFDENVKNLQAQEVVVFKVGDSGESTFSKVLEHSNDTIYVRHSNFSMTGVGIPNKSEYEEKLELEPKFYSEDVYYFTQQEIDSLHDKGEIIEIYNY